ncbi:glycosyltransferase family 25 protein [Roseateles violae]|uniref:Glycosyltransferase family 25 protein n=1 Tax=Roseateles violae TaxID=3058042 RepID=A0ABT8DUZ5_9BURK|nr:glycosyltransferase family 25 protein [Pelomonas sp. PFR6]MDN3920192.1 glycosyltransferase family 25 protein [Pelomonas sp. PFR6]
MTPATALPLVFINLDSDADRRVRMQAELARLGVAGERFEATRWTALPEDEQARLYSPDLNERQFHKPLVNGEKGCYASHLRCWQALLASDHPALVVLEDDVALEPDFAAVIAAIAALPRDWDMIKLIGRLDTSKREKLSESRPLVGAHALVRYQRVPSLTAAYVVSRSGAEKLLASRIPFGRPIDVDLRHWWENELRILGVVPAAIRLDETSFQSSIGTKAAEVGLAARWRKFRHKAAYSWLNFRHR